MTRPMNDEARMEARDAARCKADDKAYAILERRMNEADALVGELNSGKFYINARNLAGRMTGKTVEFTSRSLAVAYLLAKRYV